MATKKPTGYHRLTDEQRTQIYRWCQEGKSIRQIAGLLAKAPSTISRELRRNRGKKGYRPKQAAAMARERVWARVRKPRRLTPAIWAEALKHLSQGWSFDAICGHAALEGRAFVCRETLYREYYARQRLGEDLPPLPRSHRKRRKRGKSGTAGRGHIPDRVDIADRPRSVEGRKRFGHWEGDLVCGQGGTGYIITLTERKSRLTLFSRVGTKETDVVMSEIVRMLGKYPAYMRKTITFDNGKEFARHALVTEALGMTVYFARPYHSWERGTNENRNGIIRRVLPKGSRFDDITDEQIKRIDAMLNDRPMLRLGWRTPRGVLDDYMRSVAARSA